MKNEPLITIAIPTYNRQRYLLELLPVLLEQIQQADPNNYFIQLLIVNNASTDSTHEVVNAVKETKIKYIRNKTNIGADRNFIECVKHANGKYVWLFGDDDLLEVDAISQVLEIVKREKFDLIIATEKNYLTGLKEKTCFDSYNELINHVDSINPHFVLAHSLITSNIFLRKIFDIDRANLMLPTCYGHMYAIVSNLLEGGKVYVSDKPIIVIREQRAHFASPPKNLIFKQAQYLFFMGKKFKNSKIKKASFRYFSFIYLNAVLSLPKRILNKLSTLAIRFFKNEEAR
jgi:glycosyltransferase involved in cell wall biosynthesis